MATAKEFERKCAALTARIKQRLEDIEPPESALVSAGTSSEALRKANVVMFVRLGELALALETTPNWLLDFPEGEDREAIKGLLEAVAQSLGLVPEQAHFLADTVITALDSRAIRNSGIPRRDSARTLALDIIQRFLSEGHPRTP